jgi:isopenicillin-N epimerase
MPVNRRRFIVTAGLTVAGGALAPVATAGAPPEPALARAPIDGDWASIRALFPASRDWMHFSSFYLVSHPRPVSEAIERARRELDENPFGAVEHGLFSRPGEVRVAAAEYLGGRPEDVALTRCTTEGLALVYAGLRLRPGQEILATVHDHYVHHESIRLAARRTGATMRKIALYERGVQATEDEVVSRICAALRPETRVFGATWVHSCTGVKLPVRRVAQAIAEVNAARDAADRILFVVDGVHGFGVEDENVADMGCDFFAAGTHKWIFGPRGTGILWGRREAWAELQPTVPAFESGPFGAWMQGNEPGPTDAAAMSPGGFLAYEHLWALPAAFAFHREIGRARIAARIHELNGRIKEGLAALPKVTLHTPRNPRLASGIVCFEVEGLAPDAVVKRLHDKRVIASTSPYRPSYARLAGSLLNTPEEVDAAVRAVAALA